VISQDTFVCVTLVKAQVQIIQFTVAEFHLAASVSGSWCLTSIMTYWDIPNYLRIENAEGYVLIAVYACMRVIRISQKVFNRIA